MQRNSIVIAVCVLLAGLIGCAPEQRAETTAAEAAPPTPAPAVVTLAPTATPEPTNSPVPTPTPEPRSATTGRWLEDVPNPTYQPVMVSIENATSSRPHVGLNQADIIYEMPVEFAITRFHVIFNDEYPLFAGPVRSSRVYWMRLQQEWNTMYAHRGYGGLPYNRKWVGIHVEPYLVETGNMFWRMNGRKKVHSLMVNVPEIVDAYYPGNIAVPFERWRFADKPDVAEGKPFTSVALNFFFRRQKQKNWITFNYDAETNTLNRYQDGRIFKTLSPWSGHSPGTARTKNDVFFCQNLIVQYTPWEELHDEKGHRNTDLSGQGKADYFINGMHVTGYWTRMSYADKTEYFLDSGEKVVLAPGRTWICVHPNDFTVSPVVITYADGTTGEPATSKAQVLPGLPDTEQVDPADLMQGDDE